MEPSPMRLGRDLADGVADVTPEAATGPEPAPEPTSQEPRRRTKKGRRIWRDRPAPLRRPHTP